MDVMMPVMDGYEAVRRIRRMEEFAELPIIMVTALANREDRLLAVEAGASDFIAKPVDFTELRVRTESLLKMRGKPRRDPDLPAQARGAGTRHAKAVQSTRTDCRPYRHYG